MAIYHCSIKIISRGKGKSAVAASAYRAGEKITNEYDGITHDYTKKGGIIHTEILLPEYAPNEYADRSILWNAVKKIEKAKNSQLAREIELALPVELSTKDNVCIVQKYIKQNFVNKGMCADICIHDKNDGNPHAHVMLTMRPFEKDGTWGAKSKKEYILDKNGEKIKLKSGEYKTRKINANDWNDKDKAEEWRSAWADTVNAALEKQGKPERIDHRSYERQGIEQIPTVHLGTAASQMENKGIVTERGNMNREIKAKNSILCQIKEKIKDLMNWLRKETTKPETVTMMNVLESYFTGGELHKEYGQIRDFKLAATVYTFMQENNISTRTELNERVSDITNQYDGVSNTLNYNEGRINTLDEHIKQYGIYKENKPAYLEFQRLKPRQQKKLEYNYQAGLILYESAKGYLEKNIGKGTVPLNEWKSERNNLSIENKRHYPEYYTLRDKLINVKTIQQAAEKIAFQLSNPQQQHKQARNKGRER